MMMRLADKVAVVSGAASGMGAATARMFAREGAKVVIADVLEHEGRQVAEIGARAATLAASTLVRRHRGSERSKPSRAGMSRSETIASSRCPKRMPNCLVPAGWLLIT